MNPSYLETFEDRAAALAWLASRSVHLRPVASIWREGNTWRGYQARFEGAPGTRSWPSRPPS